MCYNSIVVTKKHVYRFGNGALIAGVVAGIHPELLTRVRTEIGKPISVRLYGRN
ncbi:MAG: hypothetical protein K2P35_15195 [Lachnospiraceae bacterium]|nr:hypothetical protein [Lachnospiraceae bacterium]